MTAAERWLVLCDGGNPLPPIFPDVDREPKPYHHQGDHAPLMSQDNARRIVFHDGGRL